MARATIACHTSVLVAHAKITSRSKKKYFCTWNALNHFDICSDSFKLPSNMNLSLGPKKYGKKGDKNPVKEL